VCESRRGQGWKVEMSTPSAHSGFEEFFRHEYQGLCRAMLLLTGNRAEAEECVEEALVRVLSRWNDVRVMASPTGYTFVTAANVFRRRRRRDARHRPLASLREVPDDQSERLDARLSVLDGMQNLSLRQRQAIVLVDFLGFTSGEAGRLLGLRDSSVRSELHRARTVLSAKLKDGEQ